MRGLGCVWHGRHVLPTSTWYLSHPHTLHAGLHWTPTCTRAPLCPSTMPAHTRPWGPCIQTPCGTWQRPGRRAPALRQGSIYPPYIPCHSYFCSLNQVQWKLAITSLTKFTPYSTSFPAHLCSQGSNPLAAVSTQNGLMGEISVDPSLIAHGWSLRNVAVRH